jgi:hypothetical protein
MAELESNIAALPVQSHKNSSGFESWVDDLLLRESQVRTRKQSRPALDARVVEYLRYVLQISPQEYQRLSNAAHGTRCGSCPCKYAARLNGMAMLDLHNGGDGRRLPCTLTLLGRANVESIEPLIAATRKA